MQIKRFEADDMNQALRLVKREFGEDAVILSAKEVRPGGLLKAMRKKRIVVTAAMGTAMEPEFEFSDAGPMVPVETDRDAGDFTGLLTQALKPVSDTPRDRVSLSARSPVSGALPGNSAASSLSPPAKTESPQAAPDLSAQARQLVSALRHYGKKEGLLDDAQSVQDKDRVPVAPRQVVWERPFFQMNRPQHRIVVVGPSGVGKSSMVAKLARYCQSVEKKPIGLISLDQYRVGANGLLENAAKILNLSVVRVHGADELSQAMETLADVPVVLIDTPGMGSGDHAIQEKTGNLLKIIDPHEVHLVLNATVRRRVMANTLDRFSVFGVNRLMLTHLDEYEAQGDAVSDLYPTTQLPAVFCGTGVDLVDGLQISGAGLTAAGHSRFFSASSSEAEELYLAGRNSKLFHHADCRFVKWGDDEDVAVFSTMSKAVEAGFSPCQECCTVSEAGSVVSRPSFMDSRKYAAVF